MSTITNLKLLGEGAYGCVYSPTVCDEPMKSTMKPNMFVTKVFKTKTEADDELYTTKILQTIDKRQEHFYFPIRTCEVTANNITENLKCSLIKDSPKKLYGVEMPKGFPSLDEFIKLYNYNQYTRADLLKMCMKVFVGVERLCDKKLMHFDIKPQNVVVIKKKDKTIETRLIDFGKLRKFTTELTQVEKQHSQEYYVIPPEYNQRPSEDHLNLIRESEVNDTMLDRIQATLLENVTNDHKIYPEKVDVYGIGMLLLALEKYLKADDDQMNAFDELVAGCIMPNAKDRITINGLIAKAKAIINNGTSGGGSLLRKTSEKIVIGRRAYVVYKGRYGKIYVKIKGVFTTLVEARKS